MADREVKLQELLDKIVKKREELTIDCKNTECMVVRESLRCELIMVDVNIKQVQMFKCLESLLTENGKCDTKF